MSIVIFETNMNTIHRDNLDFRQYSILYHHNKFTLWFDERYKKLDSKYYPSSGNKPSSSWNYYLLTDIHNDLISNGYDYNYISIKSITREGGNDFFISTLKFDSDEGATFFKLAYL